VRLAAYYLFSLDEGCEQAGVQRFPHGDKKAK